MDFPLRWIGVRVLQRRTDAHVQDTVSTQCLFRAVFPWNDSVSARQIRRLGLMYMDRVLIVELLPHADQPCREGEQHVARQRQLIGELERNGPQTRRAQIESRVPSRTHRVGNAKDATDACGSAIERQWDARETEMCTTCTHDVGRWRPLALYALQPRVTMLSSAHRCTHRPAPGPRNLSLTSAHH